MSDTLEEPGYRGSSRSLVVVRGLKGVKLANSLFRSRPSRRAAAWSPNCLLELEPQVLFGLFVLLTSI